MIFSSYDLLVIAMVLLFTSGAAPYVTMLIWMTFELLFGPIEDDEDDMDY